MFRIPTLIAALCAVGLAWPQTATARVRLEHICTIQGQQEIRLTGLGLVVGLPGTGDGAKNIPTVRALRAALSRMNQPTVDADLKNADNVAVVLIEATVPRSGIRRGQKIDCYVSSIMGSKSLKGGRLLSTPLTTTEVRKDLVVGLAGGALMIEHAQQPTTAKITQGVDLLEDVTALFVNNQQGLVTLLIDPAHASFWTSSEVARVVNSEFQFEASNRQIARSVNPGAVEVLIPDQYREAPVEFIAQVLEVRIENPHTQARVVLNAKTGTVIVTGEVEISPCVISHKSFSIEVGGTDGAPGPATALSSGDGTSNAPQQLKSLVDALNRLRVPTADIIAIIRELHATGKLHAELIDK